MKHYNKKDAIMTASRLKGKGLLPHIVKARKGLEPYEI